MEVHKEHIKTEKEAITNPILAMVVEKDSKLKSYIVEYVGKKLNCEDVTVNMIAEVLAIDFAEFTLAFAEENFMRGYQIGLDDAELLTRK